MGNGGQTSPNPRFYGYLHGIGHMYLSYQHDPENQYVVSAIRQLICLLIYNL